MLVSDGAVKHMETAAALETEGCHGDGPREGQLARAHRKRPKKTKVCVDCGMAQSYRQKEEEGG